ncbi:MAG: transposase [Deltaproteobacteria bacterium]|nr:transposase [Deltaproteobacteria bacterium]
MGKRSVSVEMTPKQRAVLEPLTRAKVAPQRLVERCRIVLMSAEGRNNEEQADELGVDRQRVRRWRVRWVGASAALVDAENGGANGKDLEKLILGVLEDNERSGAPSKFTPEEVASIIALACEPPAESGLPVSTSRDKREGPEQHQADVEKICDTYRDAPELAAVGTHVVSTDEKTGMQALERLHETKPVRPGLVERVEFEYIRHGTLSLIANFDVATGKVICPSIGPTRTEADFAAHIDKTVESDPGATWIFVVDQLDTHRSASLVRLVARRCGLEEALGFVEYFHRVLAKPFRWTYTGRPLQA